MQNQKSKIKSQISSQLGFTMIELLLYMGIFSILLVLLFQLFASIIDLQTDSQMTSSVTQDGRYILNRLVYDIRRADTITQPASFGTSGTTLQLVIAGVTDTYTLNSGNILLSNSQLGSQDRLNSANTAVSSISFVRLGNTNGKNTVSISLTLSSKVIKQGVPNTESFKTTVGIR